MLSKISQRKTNAVSFHLHVESKKPNLDFPGSPEVKNLSANAATWVPSLVLEDPTCHGAAKPVHRIY